MGNTHLSSSPRRRGSSGFQQCTTNALDSRLRGNDECEDAGMTRAGMTNQNDLAVRSKHLTFC